MATNIILQVGLYLLLLCLLTKPMGLWINTVMTGKKHLLSRFFTAKATTRITAKPTTVCQH